MELFSIDVGGTGRDNSTAMVCFAGTLMQATKDASPRRGVSTEPKEAFFLLRG